MRNGILWLLALFLASFVWIMASPVGASPDEPSHLAYAWGIATGQGVGGADPDCIQGPCPRTDYEVPQGLVPEPGCYAFKPAITAGCANQSDVDPYPSYMTRYPPPYYAIVGSVLRVGDRLGLAGQSLGYLGRLGSALISLSLLVPAFALVGNRHGKSLPYAVAALVPMALFMIGSVNPSGVEIAAAIAAGSAAPVLLSSRSTNARVVFSYSIVWLAWTRPIGWMWAGLLFATVIGLLAISGPNRAPIDRIRRSLTWFEFITASAIGGSFLWFLYAWTARSQSTAQGLTMPDSILESWIAIVLRWGNLIGENLGSLGWLDTKTPTMLVFASVALIATMSYIAVARMRYTAMVSRLIIAYFAIVVVITTALMLYQRFLWQGRYVLPPLVAGFALLGIVGDRSDHEWPDETVLRLASAAWMVSMASAAWLYARYAFGLEQGARFLVPNLSAGASWSPPIGALGFLVLLVAATLAVPLMVRWHSSSTRKG